MTTFDLIFVSAVSIDVMTFVFGIVVGFVAGAGACWKVVHVICDYFLKAEQERTEEQRRRADVYKRIADELKDEVNWPKVIGS